VTVLDKVRAKLDAIAQRMASADPDGTEIEHINHEALVVVLAIGQLLNALTTSPATAGEE